MTNKSSTLCFILLIFLVGCSEAPVAYRASSPEPKVKPVVNSDNSESNSKLPEPESKDGVPEPSDDTKSGTEPVNPEIKPIPSDMKTPEEIAAEKAKEEAEKAQREKELLLEKLERVPSGCVDKGAVTDKDFVLFNGEDVKYTASSKSIALNDGWKMDGSWNNGRIGVEMKRGQPALTFDNETFYNGFDLTPASINGTRKTFTIEGFDVYYDSTRKADGKFGMRLIKPGENEGGGDHEKRSWFKTDPAGGGLDSDLATSVVDSNCKLLHFYTSKAFIDQKKVANRFIWEMMPNWEKNDKLYIYKIVLKGFQWQ